jgi:hypothetical protein
MLARLRGSLLNWTLRTLVGGSLLSASGIAADEVTLEQTRFVDELGAVTQIQPSTTLVAGAVGDLTAEFDFQSPLLDPQTGAYRVLPIRCFWQLDVDGSVRSFEPDGDWIGGRQKVEASLLGFDPVTGQGRAAIQIPVNQMNAGGVRTPDLWEGLNSIHLRMGWTRAMTLAGGQPPTSVLWEATLIADCQWPDVRIQVMEPTSEIGDTVTCLISVEHASTTSRFFTLIPTVPDLVGLPATTVELEPTFHGVEFVFHALDLGRVRLVVKEGGSEVARSRQCSIGSNYSAALSMTSGPGSSEAEPWGEPIEPSLFGECVKAACSPQQHSLYYCGACTSGTPQVDCPVNATFQSQGDCVWDLIDVCSEYPDPTLLTCPLFQLAGIETAECGDLHGEGGVTVKIKKVVEGGVTVGGSIKYRQRCCDYRRVEGSTADVYVRDCI